MNSLEIIDNKPFSSIIKGNYIQILNKEEMNTKENILKQYGQRPSFKSVLGLIGCLGFGLILMSNLLFLFKGIIYPDIPTSLFGITPMIVMSGSMSGFDEGHIEVGDLIFVSNVNEDDLKVGDVIGFKPEGASNLVTHRIISIEKDSNGSCRFKTKGDASNAADKDLVAPDQVIGKYVSRIPELGNFALFLQRPLGMATFIGIPIFLFLIYHFMYKYLYSKLEKEKNIKLEAEIARLTDS